MGELSLEKHSAEMREFEQAAQKMVQHLHNAGGGASMGLAMAEDGTQYEVRISRVVGATPYPAKETAQ